MDPPAGGSGSEPSSDPNEQPDSSQPPASGDDGRQQGTEAVDLWCAISSSPQRPSSSSAALANAPTSVPDMDTNLWQVEGSSSARTEMDEAAAAAPVPWCTDDEHNHQPHPNFLPNISALHASSTSSIPRFPADSPNLCNIRDVDLGTGYRHPFPGSQALGRQGSLEFLTDTWLQLAPDELERYSQDELRDFQVGLEQFLLDSDPGLLPMQPPGLNLFNPMGHPETPNDESETVSSSVSIGDTPDEAVAVTSSGESQGGSAASPGILKRKGPVLDGPAGEGSDGGATGATQQQQTQHQQSMDTLQKKLKGPAAERPSLIPRTSRPPKSFQTRTEVDVIDDGYRWRKYGQKPVKNSAHPRNYYRCTTANCPVRKRVERSTEDPSHVLTTYEGTHNHPETASTGSTHARELNPQGTIASSNAEDVPLPAPVSPQQPVPLGPMPPINLPPSNYLDQWLMSHLLATGAQVPPDQARRRSQYPPQAAGTLFQRNIDYLLGTHQLFRLQYGTQYPLLANMLNLMRNFSRARPPLMDPRMDPMLNPRLDPRASLFAAQRYNAMRVGPGGQFHQDPNLGSAGAASTDSQQQGNLTSPSATSGASLGTTSSASPNAGPSIGQVSMAQRLLWLQELMGEGLVGHNSSQQPASDNSGPEKEGPENNPDVGDPPA
ncbi:hypothetical protein KC19_9G149300 [Ceratodon purpureus]|uniref:WRKY domain-containing protein n=1 Tax=Ceratodon purpureus TaxID=3225 RepID=A0A8T0GS27_CERPU|nr:hypothetical protein KC19_9G149300 [Ceratodon purpureus]KAG0562470.1 hypothetical protein KC19_9G149300 [Ceratodon purpureus]KAG0562471.1 hypothetical protein KC19_9G149300 [Ceratodon purpureus]